VLLAAAGWGAGLNYVGVEGALRWGGAEGLEGGVMMKVDAASLLCLEPRRKRMQPPFNNENP